MTECYNCKGAEKGDYRVEEPLCLDCKYYSCYDDGDGRFDIWCDEAHDIDDGSNLHYKCPDYRCEQE